MVIAPWKHAPSDSETSAGIAVSFSPMRCTVGMLSGASGRNAAPSFGSLAFMVLIAVAVAIGMKIVGVLLVVSLLVIPAAAIRPFATNPESMALLAALAGAISVALGIGASLGFDTPTGPSIVVASAALFALGLAAGAVSGARNR